ncbi:MAG: hypothetical protein QXM15_04730 [Archaeoglobaceae archaeon]
MQIMTFSEGGFVIHKLRIASSLSKFSVWINGEGKVTDIERIDRQGRSFRVKEKSPKWREIEELVSFVEPLVANKDAK